MQSAPEVSSAYGRDVYETTGPLAASAAEVIVPIVLEHVTPGSVVDYGGGTGQWAEAFRRHGAQEVLVVDGPWVDRSQLAVGADEFRMHDLGQRLPVDRQYDLAICLEVAGHIPRESEPAFVDTLTALAPVVLFSAPVPDQPGVGGGALNNHWPSYWASQFADRGMAWIDCLRLRVWDDPRVMWWYSQNIAIVVREELLGDMPGLARHRTSAPLALVHPGMLRAVVEIPPPGLRDVTRIARSAVVRRLRRNSTTGDESLVPVESTTPG